MRVLIFPGFLSDKWSAIEKRYIWLNDPINEVGKCCWLVPSQDTGHKKAPYVKYLEEIEARIVFFEGSKKSLLSRI